MTDQVQSEQRDLWLQFIKATRESDTASQQEAIKKLTELKTASFVAESATNYGIQKIEQFVISRLQPSLTNIDLEFDYTETGFDVICKSKPENDQTLVYHFNYEGDSCSFRETTVQSIDGDVNEVNDVDMQPIGPVLCDAITNDNPSLFSQYEDTLSEYLTKGV